MCNCLGKQEDCFCSGSLEDSFEVEYQRYKKAGLEDLLEAKEFMWDYYHQYNQDSADESFGDGEPSPMDLVIDHYDIPDVSDADSVSPDDFYQSDPWGDFKWWMYTEKIRQIMLDYLWQHYHGYNITKPAWLQKMGLDPRDYSLALDLFPEVIDEVMEERSDQYHMDRATALGELEWIL